MGALMPYVDQAAVNSGLPPVLLSHVAFELELETPAAVNQMAQQLAASVKRSGNDYGKGLYNYLKSTGLNSGSSNELALNIIRNADLLPESAIQRTDAVEISRSGISRAIFGDGGISAMFKNGTIVVLGIAVLVLAVLASDAGRAAVTKAVTRGVK